MILRRASLLFQMLVFAFIASPAFSQSPDSSSTATRRPRIALVLSGGGARGLAHIGVLRVLKEMHVPIDIVVGTSMGAVIGGAYAAGRSVEDLDRITRDTAWESVLADRPMRDTLDFRRREEDLLLPSRLEFAVTSDNGISLPPAAASNAALEEALIRLLPPGMRDHPANRLAIPFNSVASDLVSGELVELSETSLFLAMRASLAVPGVFAPVRVNNRLVADGGLVRNLPVDMARAMGADVVIAVNVGTPLAPEKELTSAIGVARQMLQILTEQNVQRSIKELGPNDILIAPDLAGITFLDFGMHGKAIHAGEAATRKLAERLQQLALPAEKYAELDGKRLAAPSTTEHAGLALPLAKVEVQGTRHINPDILLAQSGLHEGQMLTPEQIRKATARLYGRDDLDYVETEIKDEDGKRNVTIKPTEAVWSSSRLRLGLELASDFADNNSFSIGMMHVASSLNSYGAELRTVVRIGTQRTLGMQLWQPLAPGSPWYVAPSMEYGGTSLDIYNQGLRTYRANLRYSSATLAAGRELSNWGDIQLGVSRGFSKANVLTPEGPSAPSYRSYATSQFVRLRIDTLDSLAFPVRGQYFNAQWEHSVLGNEGKHSVDGSAVIGLTAFNAGNWAGHLYAEWSHANQGSAPQSLGGFLRLSGTDTNSIDGRTVAFGRIVMARKIGVMPTTTGSAIRFGFSAELGGGFDGDQSVRFRDLKQAGSLFLSADTRFGPLFFGTGATRGTGNTFYLFLGPVW